MSGLHGSGQNWFTDGYSGDKKGQSAKCTRQGNMDWINQQYVSITW